MPWGMDWPFCGQTSHPSSEEDGGRAGWSQNQAHPQFSEDTEGGRKNSPLFPFLA